MFVEPILHISQTPEPLHQVMNEAMVTEARNLFAPEGAAPMTPETEGNLTVVYEMQHAGIIVS